MPSTVTVTATVPRLPEGVVAWHWVLLEQETFVAALAPNKNRVEPTARSNPAPVMVTVVPPAVLPEEGEIELSDGT